MEKEIYKEFDFTKKNIKENIKKNVINPLITLGNFFYITPLISFALNQCYSFSYKEQLKLLSNSQTSVILLTYILCLNFITVTEILINKKSKDEWTIGSLFYFIASIAILMPNNNSGSIFTDLLSGLIKFIFV